MMLQRGARRIAEYGLRGVVEDGDIAVGGMQAGDAHERRPFRRGKNGQA